MQHENSKLFVTFNLNNSTYPLYQKQDNIIQYIHLESNHLPNIIKQIYKTVYLSQFSYNEEVFNESPPFYEDKLYQSGYQHKLKYITVKNVSKNVFTKTDTFFKSA